MSIFPQITHLDDVLPYIKDSESFKHYVKNGYSVIDYNFAFGDTFKDANTHEGKILRECRGLLFDLDGNLISRPLHKFFNLGEQPETSSARIHDNGVAFVNEKLDGSMIRAFMLDGNIRLGTRAGITDVSLMAEAFVKAHPEIDYMGLCRHALESNITPIFEFCGKDNRIVVQYPEEKMTLIALRHMRNGRYDTTSMYKTTSFGQKVPTVACFGSRSGLEFDRWLSHIKDSKDDIEGVVLTYSNGFMVKVKTDQYCILHRTIDDTSRINDLVPMIIGGVIDDLIPRLPDHKKDAIITFANDFHKAKERILKELKVLILDMNMNHGESRKVSALFLTRPENHLSFCNPFIFRLMENWTDYEDRLGVLFDDLCENMCRGSREKCRDFVQNKLQISIDGL